MARVWIRDRVSVRVTARVRGHCQRSSPAGLTLTLTPTINLTLTLILTNPNPN